MTDAPRTCLIVDDDRIIAEHLKTMVTHLGFEVCGVAHDPEAAIESAINHQPDYVLMDVRLGHDLDGVDAALEIVKRARSRIIFITAYNDATTLTRMQGTAPRGILVKPIAERDLKLTMRD
jgi:AmiR/NasT family two-component response regulator